MRRLAMAACMAMAAGWLSACSGVEQSSDPRDYDHAKTQRLSVSREERRESAALRSDGAAQPEGLARFAREYARSGARPPITVRIPKGPAGDGALEDVSRILAAEGVRAGEMEIYRTDGGESVEVSFTKAKAFGKACGDWRDVSPNQPSADLGCSTAANLAAMVQDPEDLESARTADRQSGARFGDVADKAIAGQATWSVQMPWQASSKGGGGGGGSGGGTQQ